MSTKPSFDVSPIVERKKKEEKVEEVDSVTSVDQQPPAKKKLQLFNRKPDADSKLKRAKIRFYDTDDEDEVVIKFVKPKELSESGTTNNNDEQRKILEKAKLERMLAGLTGTLSKDQIDSKTETKKVEIETKIVETPAAPPSGKPAEVEEKKEEKHVSFVAPKVSDESASKFQTICVSFDSNLNQKAATSLGGFQFGEKIAATTTNLALPTNSTPITTKEAFSNTKQVVS